MFKQHSLKADLLLTGLFAEWGVIGISKVNGEVKDDSDGCGAKFSVLIVSDKFQGKPLLARHRLVNSVLQEELKEIHAFTQKTLTTEQWKAQNNQ